MPAHVSKIARPASDRSGRSNTLPTTLATVPVPRITLLVETEGGRKADREVVVDGEVCRIGFHPSNELRLDDEQVSQFHSSLSRSESGWRITDLGSLNGTVINGVRVRDADLPPAGSVIEMGRSRVRVSATGSAVEAEIPVSPAFGEVVGQSVVMRRLFGLLHRVAKSEASVLIEGESGTGKEAIATEIVRRGPRAEKPLLIVDCGAIAPTVIESELFGHAKGAFTGADRERVGAFEEADGGTIILDEIGELPFEMQPKLLRAIEARQVRRVGENHSRQVDVRVIAATNRKLEREVNHGRFREDLYFRLSVVTVRVPPLREHLEDIPVLVNLFLGKLGATHHRNLFTDEVLGEMQRYEWPGNVRELRNYVERAVVLDAAGPTSARRSLYPGTGAATAIDLDEPFTQAKKRIVDEFEQRYLSVLLGWADGNISQAARKAGMDRMYLHRLVQRHGLKRGGSIKD
jgi:DNA-binding NtrC family response regulator